MERTKKFQQLIDTAPEVGTPLIKWYEWLTNKNFTYGVFGHYWEEEHTLIYEFRCNKRGDQTYKGYAVHIYIKLNSNIKYTNHAERKITEYLKPYKDGKPLLSGTAIGEAEKPLEFNEYNKNIEEKTINLFYANICHNQEQVRIDC